MVIKQDILLVDDDPDLLRLLSIRLTAAGYRVILASSGEEALDRFSTQRPDLVISDLRLGGMDGLALFDVLHQLDSSLPMILLTANGAVQEAASATHRGVFGFLSKPFNGKVLLAEVERALVCAPAS